MAFVNKYLTDIERKMFEEAKIRNPIWNDDFHLLKPYIWTIDEKRGIALIKCGVADRERPEIETYAFIPTDLKKHDILVFDMIEHSVYDDELLKKEYNVDSVIKWDMREIYNLDSTGIVSSKDDFLQILEEALTAYDVNGNPDITYKTKVFIK